MHRVLTRPYPTVFDYTEIGLIIRMNTIQYITLTSIRTHAKMSHESRLKTALP